MDAELFARFFSYAVVATSTLFSGLPAEVIFATITMSSLVPAAKSGSSSVHVTFWPSAVHVHAAPVADLNTAPAGNVSVSVTFPKSAIVPTFDTDTVYVASSPTNTGDPADFATAKSTGVIGIGPVAVASAGVGSVVLLVAVAVIP